MDRWYLSKDFFNFLTDNSLDWVTKAKRNTALYRKDIESWSGRERYVPISPLMLIKEVFSQLIAQGKSGIASVSVPNIYIKMPYETTNNKGKKVVKKRYMSIAVVVAIRLKEDEKEYEEKILSDDPATEQPAKYRGAYLIISNRFNAPQKALSVYVKRWRIEVFFRASSEQLFKSTGLPDDPREPPPANCGVKRSHLTGIIPPCTILLSPEVPDTTFRLKQIQQPKSGCLL